MKTKDTPALPEPAVWRARGQIWSLAELQRQGLIDDAAGLFSAEQVIAYAAQAVAAERERCAKLCEQTDEDGEGPDCWGWHSKDYARAIRGSN